MKLNRIFGGCDGSVVGGVFRALSYLKYPRDARFACYPHDDDDICSKARALYTSTGTVLLCPSFFASNASINCNLPMTDEEYRNSETQDLVLLHEFTHGQRPGGVPIHDGPQNKTYEFEQVLDLVQSNRANPQSAFLTQYVAAAYTWYARWLYWKSSTCNPQSKTNSESDDGGL